MKRRLAVAAGAVALILGVWRTTAALGDPSSVVTIQRTRLQIGVAVTGTLEAAEAARLGPPQIPRISSFKIAMMETEGTEVEAGAPVLGFDTTELQQRRLETANERDSARKRIEKKRFDIDNSLRDDNLRVAEAESRLRKARLKAAHPAELISSIELGKAELDLELANLELAGLSTEIAATRRAAEADLAAIESDLGRVENELADIERSLSNMIVRAPRDGVVVYTVDWNNEKKEQGDTCWRHEKVLEIPDLATISADGEVKEGEAAQVAEGQPVTLRLDAHPDIEYRGTVVQVSRMVRRRSWWNPLKVVRVAIELGKTDPERMRPGMRFRGEIEIDRLEGVLTVPASAIRVTRDGPVVLRRRIGRYRATPVTLGARSRDAVEVVAGLDEGDVVRAVPPATRSSDG